MNDGEEGTIGFSEAIAMRIFPDHHALAIKLYLGDDKRTFSVLGWKNVYAEMMSKPTDVPMKEWRSQHGKK